MEIRFNEERCRWEVFGPDCLILNGELQPLFSADGLEAAVRYAEEVEGWV